MATKKIMYTPEYAELTGNLVAAAILNQIIYWLSPSTKTGKPRAGVKKKDGLWLAKSSKMWADELGVSEHKARRAVDLLKKLGFITTKVYKFDKAPTTHIRLNERVLQAAISDLAQKERTLVNEKQGSCIQPPKLAVQSNYPDLADNNDTSVLAPLPNRLGTLAKSITESSTDIQSKDWHPLSGDANFEGEKDKRKSAAIDSRLTEEYINYQNRIDRERALAYYRNEPFVEPTHVNGEQQC